MWAASSSWKGEDSPPELPKGVSPVHILILAPRGPRHMSDPQNCEAINVGCFKPLHFWLCVVVVIN